jgi:hypothetical protein
VGKWATPAGRQAIYREMGLKIQVDKQDNLHISWTSAEGWLIPFKELHAAQNPERVSYFQ